MSYASETQRLESRELSAQSGRVSTDSDSLRMPVQLSGIVTPAADGIEALIGVRRWTFRPTTDRTLVLLVAETVRGVQKLWTRMAAISSI